MIRFRRLLGAAPEWTVSALALLLWLLGVLAGLPVIVPNAFDLSFVQRHYLAPLVVALAAEALTLSFRRSSPRPAERWRSAIPAVVLLAVAIPVHFHLKAWMPLVHPRLFDRELIATDRWLSPLVELLIVVRQALGRLMSSVGVPVDALYHGAFVGMFFVSFSAHAVFDSRRGLRRTVLGASLILLLGGVSYWVFPARGAFLFRIGESRLAEDAQEAMLRLFETFVRTKQPPAGYFVAPLAAMPSLHMAHATFLTLSAFKRIRWLFWPFSLVLVWVAIEAVATGWHYVLDLPAGVLLAFGCAWLSERMLPDA